MTTLFDSRKIVKSRPFAAGLVPIAPALPVLERRPARHTAADEAWWATHPANQTGYDVVAKLAPAKACPENQIRPRCPSERLHDGNAEYCDRRAWSLGHDA